MEHERGSVGEIRNEISLTRQQRAQLLRQLHIQLFLRQIRADIGFVHVGSLARTQICGTRSLQRARGSRDAQKGPVALDQLSVASCWSVLLFGTVFRSAHKHIPVAL